ncbi:hypothetical protein ABNC92_20805 [Paenibacillus larvae]|uniref:Helix-turn-helix domain containing protein n=1 Tax=Paenibacillus larvae subsp. pulvifaciens TaxID=1477 RepID=A0A1V0UQ26_9BACL|nr:hypothetical protein [Paenibacillus larvae]ARF66696.1 hypothetical protein B7C51_01055 [Paenibacillus larvae subsp. pulvifaciens]ARF67058.1 hypothetical protein B7C51_03380 [Paenibacillus larvae subsp. pulvifaciens]ARF69503.1 hypothetical protein B7C51_19295 [Paenibacillus larvae subsp. pulvifaciens]ARF69672.1 hypothetical protein B7C51_20310 [Paenibacillus larvae subsp. pulvifaciens]
MNNIIACEDMDFLWSISDLKQTKNMWKLGYSVEEMAQKLNRDPDEVAILIMDLFRHGEIKDRPGGARGN